MKTVFIGAGEASGDLHAAALIRALKARCSGLHFFGLGGEQLRAEGVDLIYDLRTLAVAGFWEVAKRIFEFRRIYHETIRRIDTEKPELAILVDYPGMNLRLAQALKARGCKVVYYIVPQVWAWKPGRINQIEERVDLLLSILPFEKELFDPSKLRCEFVGHPLLDHIDSEPSRFREMHKIPEDIKIVAMLPGSRAVEISRHYRIMLESVKALMKWKQEIQGVTLKRTEIPESLYSDAEQSVGVHPISVSDERYDLLKTADVSIVASGTATLEAALCGKPFCVVYRTGWITYQVARRLINIDKVGLVNIVAGKKIVPELLQNQMTAENITAFCREVLSNSGISVEMTASLRAIRTKLGEPGASERAAELVYREFLQ